MVAMTVKMMLCFDSQKLNAVDSNYPAQTEQSARWNWLLNMTTGRSSTVQVLVCCTDDDLSSIDDRRKAC